MCRYELSDDEWRLDGEPVEASGEPLAAVADGLSGLEPAHPGRMCTQELGPRWLVVWDDGSGRTVRSSRATAAATCGSLTVSGVLSGPAALARTPIRRRTTADRWTRLVNDR